MNKELIFKAGVIIFMVANLSQRWGMDHQIRALEQKQIEMQQDMNEKSKTGLLRTEAVNRYSEGIQDQVTYIYHHFNLTKPEGIQPKEDAHALVL